MSPTELSCFHPATSDFNAALLAPGPNSDAAWNTGAIEGLLRIRGPQGAHVAQAEMKTLAGFEEAYRDFASRGDRLVLGHGRESEYAAASGSTVAGTLRAPTVEFVPDGMPVAQA